MVNFLFGPKRVRITFISRAKYYEVIVSCDTISKSLFTNVLI